MEASGALPAEVRNLGQRVEGIHNGLGTVRSDNERAQRKIAVMQAENAAFRTEMREDMGELKSRMKWVLVSMITATFSFTGVIISVMSLMISGN